MDRHTDPQYRDDEGNALRVWRDTSPNNFLSQQEGRPVFDEVIFVEVIAPGSGNSTPIFEVVRYLAKEANRNEPKYSMQYERFKKYIIDFINDERSDATLSGTPLSQWSEMNRTLVAELKAQKIFTVDALAQLPDTRLNVVGPDGRTWREKAKAFLETAKSSAYATKLAADLEAEKLKTADLTSQLQQLSAQMSALQAERGGKKGAQAPAPVPPTPVADPNAAPAATDAEAVLDGLDGKPGNGLPII